MTTPKYDVTVARSVWQEATVEVLAESEELAKAAVEKSLIWFDWTNVDVDDPQVTSVKEVTALA